MNTFLAPFQCMYAMVDRIIPACKYSDVDMHKQVELSLMTFIPSIDEIEYIFFCTYTQFTLSTNPASLQDLKQLRYRSSVLLCYL